MPEGLNQYIPVFYMFKNVIFGSSELEIVKTIVLTQKNVLKVFAKDFSSLAKQSYRVLKL